MGNPLFIWWRWRESNNIEFINYFRTFSPTTNTATNKQYDNF